MTYDITGTWSGFTGPNAPLASACSPGGNQFSIIGAMTAYRSAGFAPSHIVCHSFRAHVEHIATDPRALCRLQLVGIPAYSYSYYVSAPLTVTTCPDGSRTTMYQYASSGSTCGTYIGNNGQYLYSQLWNSGYFGNFAGYRRSIDLVSRTWILWNRATGEFIPCVISALFAISRCSFGADSNLAELRRAARSGTRRAPSAAHASAASTSLTPRATRPTTASTRRCVLVSASTPAPSAPSRSVGVRRSTQSWSRGAVAMALVR